MKRMLSGKKRSFVVGIIIAAFALGIAAFCVYRFFISGALGSTFEVSVTFYDTVNQEPLSGVAVVCSRSHNRHSQEAVTDEEGRVTFDLSKGKYTLDWSIDGYYDGSQNVTVQEDAKLPPQYLVPCAGRREAYILAVWDGDADLDLCVYSDREKRCIGRESLPGDACVLGDIAGESYELAYLDDYTDAGYTVFIKDYDAAATQGVQSKSVDIRIYTAEGLLYQEQTALSVPEAAEGDTAFYECALISGKTVEKSERCIEDLTDYPWAARDKNNPAGWVGESAKQTETVYSYDDAGELTYTERTEYNESGHVTLNAVYNRFGKLTRKNTTVYDDNGAAVEHSTEGYYNEEYRVYRTLYDTYGNITFQYEYDKYGALQDTDRYEYQYDENGNMLAMKEFYINGDGEEFLTYEAAYDESGELISLHDYWLGVLERQIESEYDENGKLRRQWAGFYNNVRERAVYNIDGDWEEEEYDTQGNMVKYSVYCYNEDGELELDWWKEFQYDLAGNKILCRQFNDNGELSWWEEFQYDALGNRTAYQSFSGNGQLDYRTETEYDSEGRCTACRFYSYRNKLSTLELYSYTLEGECKTVYHYGDDGKTIDAMEIWEYNADGELTLHARTYDLETWVFRVEKVYDERGNETAYYHYVDDMVLKYGYETEYDAMDRVTVQRHYSGDGSVNVTNYTYTDVYDAAAGIVTTYKEIDGVISEKVITWYYP